MIAKWWKLVKKLSRKNHNRGIQPTNNTKRKNKQTIWRRARTLQNNETLLLSNGTTNEMIKCQKKNKKKTTKKKQKKKHESNSFLTQSSIELLPHFFNMAFSFSVFFLNILRGENKYTAHLFLNLNSLQISEHPHKSWVSHSQKLISVHILR